MLPFETEPAMQLSIHGLCVTAARASSSSLLRTSDELGVVEHVEPALCQQRQDAPTITIGEQPVDLDAPQKPFMRPKLVYSSTSVSLETSALQIMRSNVSMNYLLFLPLDGFFRPGAGRLHCRNQVPSKDRGLA